MSTSFRRAIAALQLAGAALAAFVLAGEIAHAPVLYVLDWLIVAYLFGTCALGLWAGQLLWRHRPLGYELSIVTQAVQIPLVTTPFGAYTLMFGAGVWIYLSGLETAWGVETKFRVGELYRFGLRAPVKSVELGVNVLACFLMYRLWRNRGRSEGPRSA